MLALYVIPLPLIVNAAVDLYGITLLKSGRSISSALTGNCWTFEALRLQGSRSF